MSLFALSSEALVSYLGLDVQVEAVSPQPNQKFEELFPANNRFTPSLYDSSNGTVINQAVAVNRYLLSLAKDDKQVNGTKPTDKYTILQWNSRFCSDIIPKFMPVLGAMFGGKKLDRKRVDGIIAAATPSLQLLEDHLVKNTYLVGEQLTLADIECAGMFCPLLTFVVSQEWQKKYPAIIRWASTVLNSKVFSAKLPDGFTPAGPDSLDQFWGMKAAFEGKAPKAQAKQAAPQQAKQAKQAAEEPAPKKAGHPLADLGKSTIPIDELKRTFSNKDARTEALPWFWNSFYNDDEWSLWKIDYKYNDELRMTFMSNNLIGGLFARLLASTKYMFGVAHVYGENMNNGIRGAFVVRGHDWYPAFEVGPDWESYTFTRLDASNPKDREELEDIWAGDKPLIVDGQPREIADGKTLK